MIMNSISELLKVRVYFFSLFHRSPTNSLIRTTTAERMSPLSNSTYRHYYSSK